MSAVERPTDGPDVHPAGCKCPPCYYSDDEPFTGALASTMPRPAPTVAPGGPDSEHVPVQINKYNADGHRTHAVPAHVCAACSDFEADPALLVPVSQCPTALAVYDNAEETPGWT